MKKPVLIIHGGAGQMGRDKKRIQQTEIEIAYILDAVFPMLLKNGTAKRAVIEATRMLEDCPLFNAGKGSALQEDGVARLSAALMDGKRLKFSGVMNLKGIKNPIFAAEKLQSKKSRVLSDQGAYAFSMEHELERGFAYTSRAREKLERHLKKYDTVGAVALDTKGNIAAATSTGGMTGCSVGRISDSATVAGNYANAYAGVSVTGTGEEIVEHAVAAAIVTRVEDGMTIKKAMQKSIQKARRVKADFGCIGIARNGDWFADHSSPYMAWAVRTPNTKNK